METRIDGDLTGQEGSDGCISADGVVYFLVDGEWSRLSSECHKVNFLGGGRTSGETIMVTQKKRGGHSFGRFHWRLVCLAGPDLNRCS